MYNYEYSYNYNTGVFEAIAAFLSGFFLALAVVSIVLIIANWKIFTKAGKPGWAAIVPFYNFYILLQIVGLPIWTIIFFFIPFTAPFIMLFVYWNLAKVFGKSSGFGIGLMFLAPIFLLILAFDKSTYIGTSAVTNNGCTTTINNVPVNQEVNMNATPVTNVNMNPTMPNSMPVSNTDVNSVNQMNPTMTKTMPGNTNQVNDANQINQQ